LLPGKIDNNQNNNNMSQREKKALIKERDLIFKMVESFTQATEQGNYVYSEQVNRVFSRLNEIHVILRNDDAEHAARQVEKEMATFKLCVTHSSLNGEFPVEALRSLGFTVTVVPNKGTTVYCIECKAGPHIDQNMLAYEVGCIVGHETADQDKYVPVAR
jgi:GTPase Era involved in 16S rRNA processing